MCLSGYPNIIYISLDISHRHASHHFILVRSGGGFSNFLCQTEILKGISIFLAANALKSHMYIDHIHTFARNVVRILLSLVNLSIFAGGFHGLKHSLVS